MGHYVECLTQVLPRLPRCSEFVQKRCLWHQGMLIIHSKEMDFNLELLEPASIFSSFTRACKSGTSTFELNASVHCAGSDFVGGGECSLIGEEARSSPRKSGGDADDHFGQFLLNAEDGSRARRYPCFSWHFNPPFGFHMICRPSKSIMVCSFFGKGQSSCDSKLHWFVHERVDM